MTQWLSGHQWPCPISFAGKITVYYTRISLGVPSVGWPLMATWPLSSTVVASEEPTERSGRLAPLAGLSLLKRLRTRSGVQGPMRRGENASTGRAGAARGVLEGGAGGALGARCVGGEGAGTSDRPESADGSRGRAASFARARVRYARDAPRGAARGTRTTSRRSIRRGSDRRLLPRRTRKSVCRVHG